MRTRSVIGRGNDGADGRGCSEGKKRGKVAEGIADPGVNPELFEEGWAGALERENDGEEEDSDEDDEDDDEE